MSSLKASQISSRQRKTGIRRRIGSPRIRLAAFLVLLTLLVVLGGSSRADQLGVLVLRPVALVFAAIAALLMTREQWLTVKGPVLVLGSLAVLIAAQLVPLPPSLWALLPERGEYLQTYAALGVEAPWLPISQFPVRTWNSLVCLVVPLGVVLSYGLLEQRHRVLVLPLLVGIGIASAMLGVLQILSDGKQSLYLYTIANFGSNTGLFANRNHQAIFLASLLLLVPVARRGVERDRFPPYVLNLIAMLTIVLLAFAIATTGSRIGFVVGALSAGWSAWQIYRLVDVPVATRFRRSRDSFNVSVRLQKLIIAVALILLASASVISPRSLGLDRIASEDAEEPLEDLRVETFRHSFEMIPDNMPFGGGAGTFADVYKSYEDAADISYRYVNHAHNDILEFLYEFGVPGLVFAGAFFFLFGRWMRAANQAKEAQVDRARAAALALVVILVGSVFDYPARTPIIASFAMLALVWIFEAGRAPVASRDDRGPKSDGAPMAGHKN